MFQKNIVMSMVVTFTVYTTVCPMQGGSESKLAGQCVYDLASAPVGKYGQALRAQVEDVHGQRERAVVFNEGQVDSSREPSRSRASSQSPRLSFGVPVRSRVDRQNEGEHSADKSDSDKKQSEQPVRNNQSKMYLCIDNGEMVETVDPSKVARVLFSNYILARSRPQMMLGKFSPDQLQVNMTGGGSDGKHLCMLVPKEAIFGSHAESDEAKRIDSMWRKLAKSASDTERERVAAANAELDTVIASFDSRYVQHVFDRLGELHRESERARK